MSYTIVKTDGAVLTTIANGTINTTSTSISLPGRNYAGYGEYLDTNFVHILENFADNTVPSNPIRGQLWYNTSTNTMCICPADGETTAANWYTITTTSSGGNATFGNLTITGNLLTNNITATNNLDANSISCNYLTVNVNATMANANFSGTANAATFKTTAITSGAQATNGTLTGVWTANGAGTVSPYNGVSFYVTGGNLVISNASSRGIVADFFYYSNGSPITFGGSYSNSNVAAFLPTYGGAILTTTTTATALTTGGAATVGTLTGNWTLSGGSKLQANTVLDAAQPNITSVGTLSSLNVTANIVAGNVFANSGIIKAQYLSGDGSNITNIAVAAGTSIVNGTSNVVVAASGNVSIGVSGTSSVLVANSAGANITGYANISTNAFIGANANVVGNVNAGNLLGIFANGTSNVRIPAVNGNVNISSAGNANILVVTGTGINVSGNANVGNLNATTKVVASTLQSNVANGTAPLVVISQTKVANLNVDLLDGYTTATADTASTVVIRDSSGNVNANYFVGNGSQLTGVVSTPGSYISSGTSNLYISGSGGSIISNVAGSTVFTVAVSSVSIASGASLAVANANVSNIFNGTSNIKTTTSGNVSISVGGTSNIFVVKSTGGAGANITGTLEVSGNITSYSNIVCTNDIIAYSSSDSRLKENIVPIENALDKIKKISGVMFDWKDGHEIDRKHDTGLIAQEVEEVLPEVVVTRESGYKAVRYEKIMGLVVQAIKELSDQVDELKKKL